MDGLLIGAIVVILVALVFDYTNGFHDAANAIATMITAMVAVSPLTGPTDCHQVTGT